MLTTILVSTDGSDHAEKAVDLAADIAQKYGSRVVLLHVLLQAEAAIDLKHMAEVEHLLETGSAGTPTTPAGLSPEAFPLTGIGERTLPTRTLERIGEHILGRAESKLRQKGVTNISTQTRNGDAATCILDLAEKENANLIVIGSRGLGSLKGLLMGSVSQKVAQLAPCTCMTVR